MEIRSFQQPLKLAATAALITWLSACSATTGTTLTAAAPESQKPLVTDHGNVDDERTLPVLRIWLDCSKSLDHDSLVSNLDGLSAAIKRHSNDIQGVEVICFARGVTSIWNERPERFIWGSPPQSPKPFVPNFDKAQPKERMFKDSHDRLIQTQKAEYEKGILGDIQKYEDKVNERLTALKNRLSESPAVPAPCTLFSDLVGRMQRESLTLNLVISDGYPDCDDPVIRQVSPITTSGRIVFGQVPANGHTAGTENLMKDRETFILRIAPTAKAVPIYMPDQIVAALLD